VETVRTRAGPSGPRRRAQASADGATDLLDEGGGIHRIEGHTWSFSAPTVSFITGDIVHGFEIAPGTDVIVMSVEDGALAALSEHIMPALDRSTEATGASFLNSI